MCFFLYIASPLTLSEVRSMLPPGLNADLAPSHRESLHRLHPPARTVAKLLVGACSCDLFRPRRSDPTDDERELRSRYSRARVPRTQVIEALERHRRGSAFPASPSRGWSEALAGFVVEHARNAGPTLYLLEFAHQETEGPRAESVLGCSAADVRRHHARWLIEGKPTLVS
ncbi:MAG TPA: hypothetical protein VF252_09625 [Gemmatimonadales bacterium]